MSFKGYKIALDCANGSSSVSAEEVFTRLGAEVVVIVVGTSVVVTGAVVTCSAVVVSTSYPIFLQDVRSITAKLQNNVAVDVTFSLTVTYAPIQQEAVTEGKLTLNKDMLFLVEAESQAKATYTAEVGGTYILTNFTQGALIYVVDSMGQMNELVIANGGEYVFQLEAYETVTFIILSADGQELTVQLTLTTPRA